MLKEIKNIRQIAGEAQRRWFACDDMELIVHLDEESSVISFELTYKTGPEDFVLIWHGSRGLTHMSIDDGESRPGRHKMTPIYLADGAFNAQKIAADFDRKSNSIEAELKAFVLNKLLGIP